MTSEESPESIQALDQLNRELDRRLQQLNTLFEIGKALNARFEREPILDLLLLTVLGQLIVSRAAVFLKEKDRLIFAAGRGCASPLLPSPEDWNTMAKRGHPLHLGKGQEPIHVWMESNRFATVVPMHLRGELEGLICLGHRPGFGCLGPEQDEFLLTLGNLAIAALDNARLFAERLAARRLEAELQLAQSIQTRLLPRQLPSRLNLQLAAVSVSSREVGGDYYDVVEMEDGDLRLAIGDVSGKGIPASLLMANVQAGFRVLRDEPREAVLMHRINRVIHENTELPRYITFITVRIHRTEDKLTYVNAGHNPPILIRASGSVLRLTEGGLILGIFPGSAYASAEVPFGPGDLLVLYTDGITEAMNAEGEEYGEERLQSLLLEGRNGSASEILELIRASVSAFAGEEAQRDDLTLLVARRL